MHDGGVLTDGDVTLDGDVALVGVATVPRPMRLSALPALDVTASVTRISPWRWRAVLLGLDAAGGLAAAVASVVGRFGVGEPLGPSEPYVALIVGGPLVWVALLSLSGVYDERRIGNGAAEFGRICNAALWMGAAIVATSYVSHSDFSRTVAAVSVALMLCASLGLHMAMRLLLRRRIRDGAAIHRALAVGPAAEAQSLADHIERAPNSGLRVVGMCLAERDGGALDSGATKTTLVDQILEAARRVGADTIAVAASEMLSGADLRRLSWDLEGTGMSLLVAPGVTELAGPRLLVHPIGGLPLLRVKEAEFTGLSWALKSGLDRVTAVLATLLLSPFLASVALAIRLSGPGPVFFRQRRVGLHGREFWMLKFRTMRDGAEREVTSLVDQNEHDGVLFKIRQDPRVTRVGRFLRRYSLDELPQLFNVIGGTMSLIGPRPPLRSEVERYPLDLRRRRLLVKPGMTGLWQVSGRSDLSWEETVRLDLQYVESWSVLLDAVVIWRTFRAVISGRGAY